MATHPDIVAAGARERGVAAAGARADGLHQVLVRGRPGDQDGHRSTTSIATACGSRTSPIRRSSNAGSRKRARWPDHWRDGGTIEAYEDLRRLAYGIGWRALTGESLHDKRPVAYDAACGRRRLVGAARAPVGHVALAAPDARGPRGHRLRHELDSAIDSLAAERRNRFERDDLLLDWVRANDELGATDADLRGSLKAFFGAENLHTHLAWTFYLLAHNPEAEAKLHEELDTVLNRRPDAGRSRGPRVHPARRHRVPAHLPVGPAFFRGIRGDGLPLGTTSSRPGACWVLALDDAARRALVDGPAALRSGPLGRRTRAATALRLLPVRGRAVSLPGHREVGEGGAARSRDAGSALADAVRPARRRRFPRPPGPCARATACR